MESGGTGQKPIDLWKLATRIREYAKHRARRCNERFDLTVHHVVVMLTPRVCSVTGIPWNCDKVHEGYTNPWLPSLDRKDSTRGYVYGNVHVVVWALNCAKGSWPLSVFDQLVNGYISTRRKP